MKWKKLETVPEYYQDNLILAMENEDGEKLLIYRHDYSDYEYWLTDDFIEDCGVSLRGSASEVLEDISKIIL